MLPNNNTNNTHRHTTRKMGIVAVIFVCLFTFLPSSARGKYDNTDTLVVARDGSGDFRTVGEAVEVCRAFMEYRKVIFIKKGVYKEKVVIPSWLTNIELLGEDQNATIITYDDHANIPMEKERGTSVEGKMGTFRTYTIKIEGTNITLCNLTIENNAPRMGQAVALHTEGDKIKVIGCRLLGNQDTVYTGVANTRVYFCDCYIEGTTDFIFGPSTAWFENCRIHSKADSYITAASTPKDVKYGYIFSHCQLTADKDVTKVYLGRPWRAYAYTLFKQCTLGSHITEAGWGNWKDYHDPAQEGTVRYFEYKNKGKGAKTKQRVEWSRQLNKKEIEDITLEKVFNDNVALW